MGRSGAGLRFAFVHTAHPLDPRGVHSGAETALIATAAALAARGHRVTVLGRLPADLEHEGVRYLCAGGPDAYDPRAALSRIRGECDVLISTTRGDLLVESTADSTIRTRILWPNTAIVEAIGVPLARLSAFVDHVVAVSEDQAALFADAGVPRERMTVVPNGFDERVFTPGPPEGREPGRVVFVGALVPDKGLDLLLRAFVSVHRLLPQAELVVCGSPGLWGRAPYIDTAVVSREHPYVHFRGALPQAGVAAELRRAAVCVVPTPPERYREAFPLVAVEAQACGTPVIVTRSGGLPEAVREGETGWAIEPCTPEILAAALVRTLREPERLVRVGVEAARWARARFSWTRNAEVFESLAKPPSPRPVATGARIAIVTTWRQRCGLARYAEQLVAHLPPGSIRVLAEQADATAHDDVVPVERVWRRGESLDRMVGAAIAADVDVVHVNHHGGLFGPALPAALTALRARGIRTVVTMHAPNQIDAGIAAIANAADRVLVHTDGSRLEVIANGVAPSKVVVMPQGVPPVSTDDPTPVRATMGLAPGEKLLVTPGFVQPHKGIHEVIRALAALRERVPLQYLVLGGCLPGDPAGPPYRDACIAEAERLGVRERVTFVDDYLTDEALAAYLRTADVVLLPYQTTWWEASAAARQAIASGRPVITSAALAFFDLGAAVFRTTGAFHLSVAIERVLSDPQLAAELVTQAARFAAEHAWPRIAARHQALYDELPRDRSRSQVPASPARRVLFMLREHASLTGGGDYAVADGLARALDPRRIDVVRREGGVVSAEADLAHLWNLCTHRTTPVHAERARLLHVPYVVTALYEDWPSFKVAAEAHAQHHRARLGLKETVDVERYALLHAEEHREMMEANRIVTAHASLAVATAPSEEARLRHDFPGVRTRSVPLAAPRRAPGNPDVFVAKYGSRDFVLCVGRLEPRKNQLTLLEALADDPVDVVLATGGYAYRDDYVEACRAFRRRGRTLFLPSLTNEELAAAYRAARVHVLPSWYELPGLVTLEALAQECAVVSSDRGTIREYLDDAIPYAAPDDPSALRDAIEASAGWSFATARRRAAEYTVERCAAAWLAVYDEVLAGKRTGAERLAYRVLEHG
jgi:glycosyltransferase involved in cell wall biosynthesis